MQIKCKHCHGYNTRYSTEEERDKIVLAPEWTLWYCEDCKSTFARETFNPFME